METTPEPKGRNRIYGIIGTLAWMLVAFIAGIFVGIHPEWVPNMPWAYHPNLDQPPTLHVPTTEPSSSTEPSEDNSMGISQSQPSPGAH
jgi:hypothetical protein